MKKNAIIRIVLYSVLIFLLAGLLIGGLAMHRGFMSMGLRWKNEQPTPPVIASAPTSNPDTTESAVSDSGATSPSSAPTTPASGSGSTGWNLGHSGTVSALGISELEINWASGTITIEPGDTEEIMISETADAEKSMVWYVADHTLVIRFCEDDLRFNYQPGKYHKDLTITVPKSWTPSEVTLNAASCRLDMTDLTILDELEINGASNRCTLNNCTVNDVSINGASNNFDLSGSLISFESEGVSTECTLNLTNQPLEIDMSGVSSKLDLTLPEDCGFTVDSDGLSVKLDTDFPVTGSRNHFAYGNGSCQISVDGISSDLSIHKAQ